MTPPDTVECIFLGRAVHLMAAGKLWQQILSGTIRARIYPVGETDFGPVPISPLALQRFDEANVVKTFQVEVRDEDRRRDARRRRVIPVPHWLYVVKADLPRPKPQAGPGAPEQFDWDDIEQFIRKEFSERGDFKNPENKVKGWRSQNDVIELVKDYLERRRQPVPGNTQFKLKVAELLTQLRSELPTDH